jgi:hypothetical protein
MTITAVTESIEYFAALFALHLSAAFDGGEASFEQIEEPFLCEDGKTFQLRAWLADGREFSTSFQIGRFGCTAADPCERPARSPDAGRSHTGRMEVYAAITQCADVLNCRTTIPVSIIADGMFDALFDVVLSFGETESDAVERIEQLIAERRGRQENVSQGSIRGPVPPL